jgi:Fe-S cluster biosynthesis and repair protein YggX
MPAPRIVHCKKLGKDLPGLALQAVPQRARPAHLRRSQHARPGRCGSRSRRATSTRIASICRAKDGRDFLEKQMKIFFGFEEGDLAETAFVPRES